MKIPHYDIREWARTVTTVVANGCMCISSIVLTLALIVVLYRLAEKVDFI